MVWGINIGRRRGRSALRERIVECKMARNQVGPSFSCEDKAFLCVFGADRSGTTILNNLL